MSKHLPRQRVRLNTAPLPSARNRQPFSFLLSASGPPFTRRSQQPPLTCKTGEKSPRSNRSCHGQETLKPAAAKGNSNATRSKSSKDCAQGVVLKSGFDVNPIIVSKPQKLHQPLPSSTSSSASSSTSSLASSSSSSSSWLDYDFAAYVLKPRYEKRPKWAQTLLENFRRNLNFRSCAEGEDNGEGNHEEECPAVASSLEYCNSLNRSSHPSFLAQRLQICRDRVPHHHSLLPFMAVLIYRTIMFTSLVLSSADNKLQEELLRTTQLIYSCGESGKMVPRLREPRSLYALTKELGPQQAARWPSDLQVINERVRHIQTTPSEPELFYRTTGYEKCPMVRGEANGGRVVFCYETNSSFFMKSRVGGSRNGCEQCAVNLESDSDTTLIFESRFESGNLGKAVQIGENEYELWLRYDLYTNKHTQWFYFRVTNTRADKEYRFTIVNLMKPDSLYNDGMRPVMYSEKEAALNKVGWRRAGNNIKYYRNNVRYEQGKGDHYFYSVTWTIKMAHDNDTVYFSHCYPYTYTDLQDYLLELTNDPIKSRICKQRVLCRTLAGNLVYVLTITSSSQNPEDIKHKKAVVVTARVHPGESNASWMMKGFLDFVTGNSPDAKLLRDTFIFKVVPMLNPDGVIVGNYRCSLAGRDLNRNYRTSLKDAYPSVYHTKSLIRKLLMERNIIVYCDLHGHSRRQNVFIYGCEQHPTHGISNYSGNSSNNSRKFHERIFPSMLSKNSPEKFCFKSCKFKVQKSKEGTGRVVIWNMGVQNSYTMEATFCGSSLGKKKGFHFNQHDFEMMGYHFCDTLLDYCDPDNTKYTKILADLEDKHKMEIITKIAQKGLQPDAVDTMDSMSTDTESR
ncbi:cytosolic carboxypeptidase 2 [Plakobranchus ocellatus]|uniref:Cytosolic carboxypeptidase 2 n=1 Tax=Plakobranchus ocellatus TaxID=259542 RepID=A0AAV4C9S6_9GAST|nr:cytosolic carboxypeptidase 2 [Plakobranchus ocellatus]